MFFNPPIGTFLRIVAANDTKLAVLAHVLPEDKLGLNLNNPDMLICSSPIAAAT